jgi:hypothetical protein
MTAGRRGATTYGVGQLEVLVSELVTVDGLSTGSVVVGEVTSLEHELGCVDEIHACQYDNQNTRPDQDYLRMIRWKPEPA